MHSGLRVLDKNVEPPPVNPEIQGVKSSEVTTEDDSGLEALDKMREILESGKKEKDRLQQLADEAKANEEAAIEKSQGLQAKIDQERQEMEALLAKIIGLDKILANETERLDAAQETFKLVLDEYQKAKEIVNRLRGLGEDISPHDPVLNPDGTFKTFRSTKPTEIKTPPPLITTEDLPKAA